MISLGEMHEAVLFPVNLCVLCGEGFSASATQRFTVRISGWSARFFALAELWSILGISVHPAS
jgi:hypothetical protein